MTGGTGSFGTAAVEYLDKHAKLKLNYFSRDENKQFEMQEFRLKTDFLGDIRDEEINNGIKKVILLYAAQKQVPASEYNPFECIKTNVFGSQALISACIKNNVKKLFSLD